jgi:hypothetical protein
MIIKDKGKEEGFLILYKFDKYKVKFKFIWKSKFRHINVDYNNFCFFSFINSFVIKSLESVVMA